MSYEWRSERKHCWYKYSGHLDLITLLGILKIPHLDCCWYSLTALHSDLQDISLHKKGVSTCLGSNMEDENGGTLFYSQAEGRGRGEKEVVQTSAKLDDVMAAERDLDCRLEWNIQVSLIISSLAAKDIKDNLNIISFRK